MKYRPLPRTDLRLSEVGFGVWTVATDWWGHIDREDGIHLLQKAYDLGVNFFDTADTYGAGYGEEVLAMAFPKKRSDIIIGTKFGYDIYDTTPRVGHKERPQKWDPAFIRFACEQSLRRLKTDYIDIYQLHNPRLPAIENDEIFATLDQLVKEGKVRHYAVALGPDIGWFEEGEAALKYRNIHAMQIIHSILEQEPSRRFFPIAKEKNVGLLSRVPHASEVLTDRYKTMPEFDPSDHRAFRKREWLEKAIKKANLARFIADEADRTFAQAAIKFCLAQETICSVLPNFTNLRELSEYTSAPDVPDLTAAELARLDDLWRPGFGVEEAPVPAEGGA
jgi:aryl-alcohol dehydrogenase-like predicted oxidoreductase